MPSMAFAKSTQARLPHFPAHAGILNDAADFASCCGPDQLLHPASTPASQPDPEASLPRTLASPRTGLTPAGQQELALG